MDDDRARRARDFDALPRVFVVIAAAVLQRRVHGRQLIDATNKAPQRAKELAFGNVDTMPLDDFPFGITRRCGRAQTKRRDIRLVGIEQSVREFGGFAKTQRKQPACERIERARVSRLFRAIHPFDQLQRGVGRQSYRLVEQQHAVDAPLN